MGKNKKKKQNANTNTNAIQKQADDAVSVSSVSSVKDMQNDMANAELLLPAETDGALQANARCENGIHIKLQEELKELQNKILCLESKPNFQEELRDMQKKISVLEAKPNIEDDVRELGNKISDLQRVMNLQEEVRNLTSRVSHFETKPNLEEEVRELRNKITQLEMQPNLQEEVKELRNKNFLLEVKINLKEEETKELRDVISRLPKAEEVNGLQFTIADLQTKVEEMEKSLNGVALRKQQLPENPVRLEGHEQEGIVFDGAHHQDQTALCLQQDHQHDRLFDPAQPEQQPGEASRSAAMESSTSPIREWENRNASVSSPKISIFTPSVHEIESAEANGSGQDVLESNFPLADKATTTAGQDVLESNFPLADQATTTANDAGQDVLESNFPLADQATTTANDAGQDVLESNFPLADQGKVSLSDAPLIGAPVRLFSFVTKFVSGADLVRSNVHR